MKTPGILFSLIGSSRQVAAGILSSFFAFSELEKLLAVRVKKNRSIHFARTGILRTCNSRIFVFSYLCQAPLTNFHFYHPFHFQTLRCHHQLGHVLRVPHHRRAHVHRSISWPQVKCPMGVNSTESYQSASTHRKRASRHSIPRIRGKRQK